MRSDQDTPNVVPSLPYVETGGGRALWERDFSYLKALLKITEYRALNNRATAPALTMPIKSMLDAGLDVLTTNMLGQDGFEILGRYIGKDMSPPASSILRSLMDNGYPVMKNRSLDHLDGLLLQDVMTYLTKRWKSAPLMDDNGGGHVHYLAEYRPDKLNILLNYDAISKKHDILGKACASHARASDGAAPLHLLWRNANACDNSSATALWDSTFWFCFYKNADIQKPDHAGVRPIDLMAPLLHTLPPSMFLGDEHQALVRDIQAHALSINTHSVSLQRAAPRL